MRAHPAEHLVTAFFAGILITFAAGIGASLFLSFAFHGFSSDRMPHAKTTAGNVATLAGIAILVAGCCAAALILAGRARDQVGLGRFAAASLGLMPMPFVAVIPALAAGAGLGFWAAVVLYGVLATAYAYAWARLVGRWADRHSRRA
jgi:hypothetical protein